MLLPRGGPVKISLQSLFVDWQIWIFAIQQIVFNNRNGHWARIERRPRTMKSRPNASALLLPCLLGLTLFLKFVVVWQLRHHPLVQPGAGLDTTAYADLAQRVLAGDWGLGPGLYYVSPLYIYFLAASLGLTHSYTAVRLIQILLGTAGVAGIYFMAREWFGQRAAWIAGLLAACTGLFTFYEALILQTSLDVCLTSAALLALTLALKRADQRWLLGAGVVFGVQTLNRPNIALAVAGLVAVMWLLRRWRPGVVLAAGLLIGMAPAAVRNAVVAHEFSLVSSHGGLNFYIGNHDGANGFYQAIPGVTPNIKGQQQDARRVAERAVGRTLTDAQTSDYFFDQSLNWMRAHRGNAAWLMVRKFGWVFHAEHVALPYSYPFYQYDVPTWLRFYVIGPWLLVPLGLVGLVFAAPPAGRGARRADYLIWAAFVPSYAAAVALFFMSERYRLPLLVPLAAASGGAIDHLARQITARRVAALALPLAAGVAVGILVNTRGAVDNGRWQEGLRMAQQLAILGRYDESDAWVERLEATAPRRGMAHDGVGMQLLLNKQPARALGHLSQAAELDPDQPEIQYALGEALLGVDRPADALPHLRRGFDGGAALPMAGYHLAVALEKTGDLTGAASIIPRIAMGDESTQDDWLLVGRLAAEVRAPDVGEPFFRHAVHMDPNRPDARQQYGLNLLVLGRFEDASRELSEAVRLDPRNAASFSHLAYSEAKLGRMDDARQHLAAALALDPGDPMAQQLVAVLR